MSEQYLYPTFEAGKHLLSKNLPGAIVNLNLIRLKLIADYTAAPHLIPATAISGREAFFKYIAAAKPFLEASGGEIVFIGEGNKFLIGPEAERWDIAMLIRQKSVGDFFNFEKDEAYMKIAGHRTAAIEDSRLLPLEELYSATGTAL